VGLRSMLTSLSEQQRSGGATQGSGLSSTKWWCFARTGRWNLPLPSEAVAFAEGEAVGLPLRWVGAKPLAQRTAHATQGSGPPYYARTA
jgi:hypothetical protein